MLTFLRMYLYISRIRQTNRLYHKGWRLHGITLNRNNGHSILNE